MKHESRQPLPHDAAQPSLLVTTLPLPNGKRVLAAATFRAQRYQWRLLYNGKLLRQFSTSSIYDTVAVFDLTGPILPGEYRVEVY